jgi:hypothetical protein
VRILPRIHQFFEKVRLDTSPAERRERTPSAIAFKKKTIRLHAAFSRLRQIASQNVRPSALRDAISDFALQSLPRRYCRYDQFCTL